MGLIWAIVENQKSAGTTATTLASILNTTFPAHNLHIDMYCRKNSTNASTILLQIQKMKEVHLNTTSGTPESSIQAQDLVDFHPEALGIVPYISALSAADTQPQLNTFTYPFSPFPNDPTEPFAMPANRATTFECQFLADGTNTFNTYTYDLTIEGTSVTDKPNPKGYIKFVRDEETGVVGQALFTRFLANRLLGVLNFETTPWDSLGAGTAVDVTTIRTQELTFSRNTIYGPFRPARAGGLQFLPKTTTFQLTTGTHFHNLGINNRVGNLGVDTTRDANTEIKTTAGKADAYRTYPVCLVQ